MAKMKLYPELDAPEMLMADRRSVYGLRTYVSLFSSAGVGCYGFKEEGFYCVATVELLERRLKIQKFNQKCVYNSGYICGDMTTQETKDKVFAELAMWEGAFNLTDLDVLIATPPCQGMSVANHKKKDELKRNSLVVESIKMARQIKPKFFIFENVRAFLTSVCTDVDGQDKSIKDAIEANLSGAYNILYQVVNFKDYGNPSSRTRTLVIGVRKDLKEVTPYDIFPDKQPERTLRQVIGHLPSLKKMGEISEDDIYHNFRKYSPRMESWIADIKEGQSAFDNIDVAKIPHSVKNGVIVYNARKNGDKYTRQYWDKVAPCVHTRNDIMASQNTVHPVDNRVFSIREVMLMMSVPSSFNWSDIPFEELNKMSLKEKEAFLKKEEMNIRQNLGEAVPTIIFKQIAAKVRKILCKPTLSEQDIKMLIDKKKLATQSCLLDYIRSNSYYSFAELSKIAELANAQREDNSAYYTRQDICYTIVKSLPDAKNYTELNILEPSIGVGNFLPVLILKYTSVKSVNIDVVDIDANSLEILKELVAKIDVPNNIHINYINADFLLHSFDKKYDIVVGNPPYKKLTKEKQLLAKYKIGASNKDTNNIFSFFIEKAMRIGNVVSLIVPKSLINAPEFDATRNLMKEKKISRIIDFGEKGFKGVKIETICFILDTQKKPQNTIVESYITDEVKCHQQVYLTDDRFPYWIIYRNKAFDEVADKMEFNVFKAYRDRVITKAITKDNGKIRVLKSRNIGNNEIVDIPDYDCYIDSIEGLDVAKYLNQANCVLLPNLTYNPRACFLPKGCIADGSVAILTLAKDGDIVTNEDLAYAHILNVEMVDGALTFSVANEDLLDYISRKDRNAYNFLYCYFMKVMLDSGFMKYFEEYSKDSLADPVAARDEIYERYYRLINGNTPSHSRLDIRRMFHKVFNVYAAEHHLCGSNGKITYYSDLMYNKKNWRDMDKDKTVTRQEAMTPDKIEKQEAINTYYVQKAIALIRKIQTVSEVNDSWSNGEATQVHHIFPKSQFPQIAHYVENLILLTATQHNTKAHPNNKTQQVNKDYQLVCLLAKADTIENSLLRFGEKYYRKESFVYVINTGLTAEFSTGLSFKDIKKKLVQIYNAA